MKIKLTISDFFFAEKNSFHLYYLLHLQSIIYNSILRTYYEYKFLVNQHKIIDSGKSELRRVDKWY